jgi:hypothetical protein
VLLLLLLLYRRKHEDMSEALIDQLASSGKLDLSQQQWGRVKDIIRGRTTPGNGWWEELQWLPSVSIPVTMGPFARICLL